MLWLVCMHVGGMYRFKPGLQNLRVLKYVGETKMQWGKYWIELGFSGVYINSFPHAMYVIVIVLFRP